MSGAVLQNSWRNSHRRVKGSPDHFAILNGRNLQEGGQPTVVLGSVASLPRRVKLSACAHRRPFGGASPPIRRRRRALTGIRGDPLECLVVGGLAISASGARPTHQRGRQTALGPVLRGDGAKRARVSERQFLVRDLTRAGVFQFSHYHQSQQGLLFRRCAWVGFSEVLPSIHVPDPSATETALVG